VLHPHRWNVTVAVEICPRRRYLESMYENIERQGTNNHMEWARI